MPKIPGLSEKVEKQIEVDNGLLQFDFALNVIEQFLDPEWPFALRPSLICDLQKIAV